ncbi:MAG: hypothetical protein WC856_03195 [Methylococcaceae bacterium]
MPLSTHYEQLQKLDSPQIWLIVGFIFIPFRFAYQWVLKLFFSKGKLTEAASQRENKDQSSIKKNSDMLRQTKRINITFAEMLAYPWTE